MADVERTTIQQRMQMAKDESGKEGAFTLRLEDADTPAKPRTRKSFPHYFDSTYCSSGRVDEDDATKLNRLISFTGIESAKEHAKIDSLFSIECPKRRLYFLCDILGHPFIPHTEPRPREEEEAADEQTDGPGEQPVIS